MHSDQVTPYLLGQLPEGEMQRLKALQESDENFRQRVRMIEDDLIDCFVKGQLRGDDLMRFRRYFLAAPANRERVKIAQGFLDDLNIIQASEAEARWWHKFVPAGWRRDGSNLYQAQPTDAAQTPGFGQRLWGWIGEPSRVAMQGLALVLLAICLWLVGEVLVLSYKRTTLQANRTAPESQTAQQPPSTQAPDQPRETLEQLKAAALSLEPTPSNTPDTNTAETRSGGGELQPASFALRPASRGAEGVPELAVKPNAEEVVFQLELGRDDHASYRAELRAQPDGMRLWQSGTLKARAKDYGKTLEVKVPAALLRTRAYTLKVYGIDNSGNAQESLNYSFRINKQ